MNIGIAVICGILYLSLMKERCLVSSLNILYQLSLKYSLVILKFLYPISNQCLLVMEHY